MDVTLHYWGEGRCTFLPTVLLTEEMDILVLLCEGHWICSHSPRTSQHEGSQAAGAPWHSALLNLR